MKWEELLRPIRLGKSTGANHQDRSQFQLDYDRIIFSAAFRRLQNKTQVFPLPGAIFVHNRLTHSIEVASVGRSLGNNAALKLSQLFPDDAQLIQQSFSSIVSAACLAHDLGNPPFGHSGEDAIRHFFINGAGRELCSSLTDEQRSDFCNFDGNANTFRLLSHNFKGRREGGFALTMPTLASIVKYPRSSAGVKKFGYFQQDRQTYMNIAESLGIPLVDEAKQLYARHPLVFLVEAADDICYQVMDAEDACRLGILSFDETYELLMGFFDKEADKTVFRNFNGVRHIVTDTHEQVAYMRSIVIGRLVERTVGIFCDNIEAILRGEFTGSLTSHLSGVEGAAMNTLAETAIRRIYRNQTVAQVELSGFQIIGTLLDRFAAALTQPENYYSKLIRTFIPSQYNVDDDASVYDRLLCAVDTVSGMTDLYALDLYKKVTGGI
ncbi:MAG: dNTP triphosphohydrolase [Bacteroidales bacterium]|nr:dNTP triphosphohydrolase [Bacteroidales bacterium]